MSFGGSVDKTKHSDQVLIEDFTNAIEDAYKAGIFSVVAAGNNGVDACNELPAMIDTAITVSATDYYLDLASFSNFGNCIDVCAPGVAIDSAYFSDEELVKTLHGTSMAAPHITAYIALLYSDPVIKYTLKDIQNILLNNYLNLNTVKDLGEEGKDSSFGCGLPILNNLMGQVAYKVNYYLEPIYDLQANTTPELNNYQLINSKTYYGVLGELTNFIPDNYNGFTQIEFDEQIIDENTIINIYFKRNIYKLVIQTSEIGIQSVTGEGEYLYGADVELFAELQEEYIWDVWEIKECTSNIFYNNFKQGVCEQKFKMPDSDLILSANAKNKSEQNLDWSNLFIWGSGFIVLVIFLMYISRPRIKNH